VNEQPRLGAVLFGLAVFMVFGNLWITVDAWNNDEPWWAVGSTLMALVFAAIAVWMWRTRPGERDPRP